MTIEALEEALKDESGEEMHYYRCANVRSGRYETDLALRNDILALIKKEKESAVADYDQWVSRLVDQQSRPLTLEDWKRAMENPEELKKFQRRDGKPHDYIRVLCVDAPENYPVKLLSKTGGVAHYMTNGGYLHYVDCMSEDLILPPRKLKRVVRYVSDFCNPSDLGWPTPAKGYAKPVTLIYEE